MSENNMHFIGFSSDVHYQKMCPCSLECWLNFLNFATANVYIFIYEVSKEIIASFGERAWFTESQITFLDFPISNIHDGGKFQKNYVSFLHHSINPSYFLLFSYYFMHEKYACRSITIIKAHSPNTIFIIMFFDITLSLS